MVKSGGSHLQCSCVIFNSVSLLLLYPSKESITPLRVLKHPSFLHFSDPKIRILFVEHLTSLISNFHHVLNVIFSLLGDSQASEFYMPKVWNTLCSGLIGGVSRIITRMRLLGYLYRKWFVYFRTKPLAVQIPQQSHPSYYSYLTPPNTTEQRVFQTFGI